MTLFSEGGTMRETFRFTILVLLVALAVQARLIRPGDLTPTWPLLVAVASGAAFALFRRNRASAPPDA